MKKFQDLPDDAVDLFRAHVKLYLTDPARAHMWDATPVGGPGLVPTLLLTTSGRKSGRQRHAPVLYIDNGGTYYIMASRGGTEVHPAWYFNLLDHPECEIRVGTLHTRARARIVTGDERAAAWKKITELRPVYAKYQARTDREIPVVELTPFGDPIAPAA